jgi:hypothetical protein
LDANSLVAHVNVGEIDIHGEESIWDVFLQQIEVTCMEELPAARVPSHFLSLDFFDFVH